MSEFDEEPAKKIGIKQVLAWVLPFGTSFAALAVGLALGAVIVALIPRKPSVVEVQKELNNEEMEELCRPKVEDAVAEAAEDLEAAEEKVRTLEAEVEASAQEVDRLEAVMRARAERGRALVAELEAAKERLAELETQLAVALEEKEALQTELVETKQELAEQVVETQVAKEDALTFKWKTFISESQLLICEKGGRKKMGRCRETVAASLTPELHERFEHCIRAGQEIPSLGATEEESDQPEFSEWLGQDNRITKDWYILLCDPTLPEAEGFRDEDLGRTPDGRIALPGFPEGEETSLVRPGEGDIDWEFEDLDDPEGTPKHK